MAYCQQKWPRRMLPKASSALIRASLSARRAWSFAERASRATGTRSATSSFLTSVVTLPMRVIVSRSSVSWLTSAEPSPPC